MLTQLADESRARRSTLGRGKGLAVADEARARGHDVAWKGRTRRGECDKATVDCGGNCGELRARGTRRAR
jgi:hypothetical protein